MPTIAKEAADFAKRVEAIKTATVNYVYELGQGMTRQELTVLVAQIDFTALVNELGYGASVDQVAANYVNILRGLDPIAPLSEEVLQALVNTDKAFLAGKGADLANTMKRELTQGIIGGSSRAQIAEAIKEVSGFRPDQVETLIDTSQRVFSRSVTAAMADELPEETKYVYSGALDDKTRDICVQMLSAGALTRAEIEAEFGNAFIEGGGWNCRHSWRIATRNE